MHRCTGDKQIYSSSAALRGGVDWGIRGPIGRSRRVQAGAERSPLSTPALPRFRRGRGRRSPIARRASHDRRARPAMHRAAGRTSRESNSVVHMKSGQPAAQHALSIFCCNAAMNARLWASPSSQAFTQHSPSTMFDYVRQLRQRQNFQKLTRKPSVPRLSARSSDVLLLSRSETLLARHYSRGTGTPIARKTARSTSSTFSAGSAPPSGWRRTSSR